MAKKDKIINELIELEQVKKEKKEQNGRKKV